MPIYLVLAVTGAVPFHSVSELQPLVVVVFDILLVVSKTHVAEPFAASLVVAELKWEKYSVFS